MFLVRHDKDTEWFPEIKGNDDCSISLSGRSYTFESGYPMICNRILGVRGEACKSPVSGQPSTTEKEWLMQAGYGEGCLFAWIPKGWVEVLPATYPTEERL